MLLKFEPQFAIVGESTDAASLRDKAKALQPDLILLDWELPGNSIGSLVRQLRKANAPCKVIVLSPHPESEQAALDVGADAFVSKSNSADSLLGTLHRLFKREESAPLVSSP
jgi:DNA-binding NarL/FixJ family response regulator